MCRALSRADLHRTVRRIGMKYCHPAPIAGSRIDSGYFRMLVGLLDSNACTGSLEKGICPESLVALRNVLDLYDATRSPAGHVIWFDECTVHLIGETRDSAAVRGHCQRLNNA